MTEKIHALQPMLDALHIKQTVSFDDCNSLFREVATKTGSAPPPFELSGNQWYALVNLAIARFVKPVTQKPDYWLGYGLQAHTEKPFEDATLLYTTPPQRTWVGLTNDEVNDFAAGCHLGNSVQGAIYKAEAKLKEKNT